MPDFFDQLRPHMSIIMVGHRIESLSRLGEVISVASSNHRTELFTGCLPVLAELRQLALEYLPSKSPYILQCLAELEQELNKLASLKHGTIIEDRRDGNGNCPACGNEPKPPQEILARLKARQFMSTRQERICCKVCCEEIRRIVLNLNSSEGFDSAAITAAVSRKTQEP